MVTFDLIDIIIKGKSGSRVASPKWVVVPYL